ncbi:MAG: glutamate racemase [Candidatus Melainabacteria bacterium]|nr:MAG: glutamate racemase [Candidatus Melainabacteria bacterium]
MIISKNNNDSNSPIAFFDSGVGGLTVYNKVKKILPNENYVYYGDTLHVPYGEKSKEQLLEYSDSILKFFESKHCKAVVMACNTTSSVIYDDICGKYNFKLYPIVQSVAEILSTLPITRLGVFATSATINSQVYPREIAKYNNKIQVFGQHCPEWVNIVENNTLTDLDSIATVKEDLDKMLKNHPDKIVLGCTHYPFLLKILSKFASEDLFIDPAISFAQYIKDDLEKAGLLNSSNSKPAEEFYVSSEPEKFKIASKMFYNLKETPKLLNF